MRSTRVIVGFLAAFYSTAALADDDEATKSDVSDFPAGTYSVQRPIQGSQGTWNFRLYGIMNLSKDLVAEPVSIAPDLSYSVTDRFQLSLVHTGPMGWQTLPGSGFCVTGENRGCPRLYNNIGFDAMFGLLSGRHFLSAQASFYVLSFADPSATLLTLGLPAKFGIANGFAIFLDPQFGIGVTGRDEVTGVKEAIFVPVQFEVQAGAPLQLSLLSGISGPLDGFGDAYQVPVGVGALYNINAHFDLGLRFSFDNLLGKVPVGVDRIDTRSLSLLIAIRG